jgi:NAD(P)H-dependent flavin oxidoreductase YrpB (nitropropane dioxygenase family)
MSEALGVDAIIAEGKESGGPPLREEVWSVQETL